jgi:hypothetical protein
MLASRLRLRGVMTSRKRQWSEETVSPLRSGGKGEQLTRPNQKG